MTGGQAAGSPASDPAPSRASQPRQPGTAPAVACLPCLPGRPAGGKRALYGWSPPDLPADTPLKRHIDRLVPRTGAGAFLYFAAIFGLLMLAPHVPVRAELTLDGLAALGGAIWCGLNFWRCRHAHCLVTTTGWLALVVAAWAGAALGHSVVSGYEQPVFLGVLAAAIVFEMAWRWARGSSAVMRRQPAAASRPGIPAGEFVPGERPAPGRLG